MRVYFETLNTYGVRVVDEASSDPAIPGVIAVGIDADHIQIAKPPKADVRVKDAIELIGLIVECNRKNPTDGSSYIKKALTSSDQQLPHLAAMLRAKVAANPTDEEARMALGFVETMSQSVEHRRYSRIEHCDARDFPRVLANRLPGWPLVLILLFVGLLVAAPFGFEPLGNAIDLIWKLFQ